MEAEAVSSVRRWFENYSGSFLSGSSGAKKRAYALKAEHTRRVCENAALIARIEGVPPPETSLAEAAALLHDVGRFGQFEKYGTFLDRDSVNHGRAGAEVIVEEGVLEGHPERDAVLDAVRFHNAISLPPAKDERTLLVMRVVRDADKLDIWRVALEYFGSPEDERAEAVGLGFADVPGFNPALLGFIKKGRIAPLSEVRSLDDFKLMQLSWVFDLNLRASFCLLLERGHIEGLMGFLPRDPEVVAAGEAVSGYAAKKCRGDEAQKAGLEALK